MSLGQTFLNSPIYFSFTNF